MTLVSCSASSSKFRTRAYRPVRQHSRPACVPGPSFLLHAGTASLPMLQSNGDREDACRMEVVEALVNARNFGDFYRTWLSALTEYTGTAGRQKAGSSRQSLLRTRGLRSKKPPRSHIDFFLRLRNVHSAVSLAIGCTCCENSYRAGRCRRLADRPQVNFVVVKL